MVPPMVTELWQLVMVLVPLLWAAMLAPNFADVLTVPAIFKSRIVAPSMYLNGAQSLPVALRLSVSVLLLPRNVPWNLWSLLPAMVEALMSAFSFTYLPLKLVTLLT